MAKQTKTNSGSTLNAGELGSELPNANFPADQMPKEENGAHSFTEGADNPKDQHEQQEEREQPKKPKFRTLISGAEFWKFADEEKDGKVVAQKDGEVFEGYYKAEQKREKDGQGADQKAGSVIGYVFEQAGTGTNYLIGKSHSIEKALTASGFPKDKLFRFEFLGKGKNSSGQQFNRFEIAIEE